MTIPKITPNPLLVVLFVFAYAASVLADGVPYTFDPPQRWVEIPSDKLKQRWTEFNQKAPGSGHAKVQVGYRPDLAGRHDADLKWFNLPYLLLGSYSKGRVSECALKDLKRLRDLRGYDDPDGEPLRTVNMNTYVFDDEANIVWYLTSGMARNIGLSSGNNIRTRVLHGFVLSENGFVQTRYAEAESEASRSMPFMRSVSESVELAASPYRYEEDKFCALFPITNSPGALILLAIILVGLLKVFLGSSSKKGRRKRAAQAPTGGRGKAKVRTGKKS